MPPNEAFSWTPSRDIVAKSNLGRFLGQTGMPDYESLLRRSDADPAWLMEQIVRFCDMRFYSKPKKTLDLSRGNEWARWFVGGTTNMVLNCLDRHRDTPAWDSLFLTWEGESPTERRRLTYREFDGEVHALAAGLRTLGLGRGHVIALYMPNIPEALVAFFAVLKIGGVVMPLFSGFGPQPIVTRLTDGAAKAVITADGTWRRGHVAAMKTVLDEALEQAPDVRHVIVVPRMAGHMDIPMRRSRDRWWNEVAVRPATDVPTEEMPTDAPAVVYYTSGTTGKPKGCVWTHVSFLGSMVTRDVHICCDFKPDDRWFWLSDMGWMVGAMGACIPSYFGASVLVAEGTPDYPDTGRFWRLIQEHRVTYLGVAPTLIRGLMRYGDSNLNGHDLSSLRMTISGGEAWPESSWRWFFENVCKERLPVMNISGGTEVGGCILLCTTHHPMKPGSFGAPALGVAADIVDEGGRSVPAGHVGELVLRQASIGMTKGLWNDDQRYLESYWSTLPGVWLHGDFAKRDTDGLFYILGRSDDTLKISGKRTGPAEIEGLLMATGMVAEAAVIGVPDSLKGSAIVCACVPMPAVRGDDALARSLTAAVVAGMGASYRPRHIVFATDLPKTRNLKIMRRVIRATYTGDDPGDLSALINRESVEELRSRFAGLNEAGAASDRL